MQLPFDKGTVTRILSLLHSECCRSGDLDQSTNRLIAQNLVNAFTFLIPSGADVDVNMLSLLDSIFQFCCRDSLRSEYGAAFVYIEQLYERFLQDLIFELAPLNATKFTLSHAMSILTNIFSTKCQVSLHDITSFNFDSGIDGIVIVRSLSQFQAVNNFVQKHFFFASTLVWEETRKYFER